MCDVGNIPERSTGITGLVDELVVAAVNNRIYWHGHPRVVTALDEVMRRLREYFETSELRRLVLGVVDGYLIHDDRPLLGASLSAPKVIAPIERIGAGGIEFHSDVEASDLVALLEFLADTRTSHRSHEDVNAELDSKGCHRIRILQQPKPEAGSGTGRSRSALLDVPVHLYQGIVETLQGVSVAICRGNRLDLDETEGQIEAIMKTLDADPKSMLNLARYEQYDSFTFGHSVRVCFLALNFSRALTFDSELRRRIGVAGMMHDIGKSRVPFEILHCQSRLSAEARREMEKHTTFGAEILLELAAADPIAIAAAFGHHRTSDGRGYPDVPESAAVSKITQLIKLCDVYEALTAVRPYKAAMSPVRAYRIMLSMKGHFDASLLRRFINVNGIYPTGSMIELSTHETARIERQSANIERPVVTLITSREGDDLDSADQRTIDLSEEPPGGRFVTVGPFATRPVVAS